MTALILLGLTLLTGALLLLRYAQRQRQQTGLPAGTVVYDDTSAGEPLLKPLLSRRYGLVGRPDYLVRSRTEGELVPVEVKSGRAPERPYASHVLQLGAYCLLVEDCHRHRPPYGLLRYADATFEIPFTDQLRYQVLEAADAIRRARTAPAPACSHAEPQRCRACGYRNACDERLA